MTWNYRIIHYQNGDFGLHEVYYDEKEKPTAITRTPVQFVCNAEEGHEGIVKSLRIALYDAEHRPVMKEETIQ